MQHPTRSQITSKRGSDPRPPVQENRRVAGKQLKVTGPARNAGFRNAVVFEVRELAKRLVALAGVVTSASGQAFTPEEAVYLHAHLKGTGDALYSQRVGPNELATKAEEDLGFLALNCELGSPSTVAATAEADEPGSPVVFARLTDGTNRTPTKPMVVGPVRVAAVATDTGAEQLPWDAHRAAWAVVARSRMNRDTADLLATLGELVEKAERLLDAHDEASIVKELHAAGIADQDERWEETAANVLHDVQGMLWVLKAAEGVIGSEMLPVDRHAR